MILDIFPTYLCNFKRYQKNFKFDSFKIFTYQRDTSVPKNQYNITHIHDKVRVIGRGRTQNQKLFNLHLLIING